MGRFFCRCVEFVYLYLGWTTEIEEKRSFYVVLFCILLFIDLVVIGQIRWNKQKSKVNKKSK